MREENEESMTPWQIFVEGFAAGINPNGEDATVEWLHSESKKDQERIAASLSLLDSPQPGTVVKLAEGEEYRFFVNGWADLLIVLAPDKRALTVETALPLLKALVKAGAAAVLSPQEEGA